jgi:CheY-like chemotaxis protein
MLLLVDNDPKFLERAAEELVAGRGILFASSAEQAKELMRVVGAAISVVMIDLDLPGQDGFSLTREMRHHFPDLPVIAISGVYQAHVLDSAKLLGATDALSKPITTAWNVALADARRTATG